MSDVCKLVFQLVIEVVSLAGAAIRYSLKNPRKKKVKNDKS